MSLATISVQGKLWTNETQPLGDQEWEGEDGLVEVERSDANVVTVHFRHYADDGAVMSCELDRAGALALAGVLRAALEPDD
jgi:hypothetical protein